jgi:insertion element IS1 protein InsB
MAMEAMTRQIIAFHVGDRSRQSAQALWGKLPTASQEPATFSTDCDEVYMGVIPSAQHRAITKLARQTNHVERFNCALRQRASRLVRATLSFSKKLIAGFSCVWYSTQPLPARPERREAKSKDANWHAASTSPLRRLRSA